jgi:hypothetical protein
MAIAWTNGSRVNGTNWVRSIHFTEIVNRINKLRALEFLGPDSTLPTFVGDNEVPRKDAHAEWWCSQVTKETGVVWKYAKLPYRKFHGKWPASFAALVKMFKPGAGLSLIFELENDDEEGNP